MNENIVTLNNGVPMPKIDYACFRHASGNVVFCNRIFQRVDI